LVRHRHSSDRKRLNPPRYTVVDDQLRRQRPTSKAFGAGPFWQSCRPGWIAIHALAYNLGNFLRTLATPEPIKDWSLTSLKDKLIKIGAMVVSHGRYVIFQIAEVAMARQMFQEILRLIAELRPQPPPVLA